VRPLERPTAKLLRRARFRTNRWFRSGRPFDRTRSAAPVVVGALGGSGTRAVVELLVASGIYMGEFVDADSRDSLYLRRFLNDHFDALAADPEREPPALRRALHRTLRAHRADMPDPSADWGWKNPRSLWLLPFLARSFPDLRFIQLLRDGRDMALSGNRVLLDRHGRALLGDRRTGDKQADQLALWALGNVRAADAAERLLGPRALRIRYEDLCAQPVRELERLVAFLERPLPDTVLERIAESVRPSPGLGRGRLDRSPGLVAATTRHADALRRFGYAVE